MNQAELENARLEQIASEYRQKGYAVLFRPGPEETPQFLAPFQPDLIATSPQESVVVEVKSSPDLASESFVRLAEAVEAEQGWRLQLVVVNPPAAPEVPRAAELVPEERIDSLLSEAHALNREKRYEAATITAWAAAEATFRHMARASDARFERKSSGTILKQLYVLGLIDPDQYHSFSEAMEFRDAYAHGFAATVTPEAVDRFLREIEELRARPAA